MLNNKVRKMKIISCFCIAVAVAGVVAFWIFGLKGQEEAMGWSLIVSGIAAWVFLMLYGIIAYREKSLYY